MSLEVRIELQHLKLLRPQGACPVTARKAEKLIIKNKKEKLSETNKILTVKDVVDLYLTEVIEDKVIIDPRSGVKKNIEGARNLKGQLEARRTLYADVVAILGNKQAESVVRKDIVEFIKIRGCTR